MRFDRPRARAAVGNAALAAEAVLVTLLALEGVLRLAGRGRGGGKEGTVLQYERTASAWDRGQVAARLTRLGPRAGFPVLDLTRALRAADRGWRERPYFAWDGHWTALGHRAAAAEIQAFLERSGWLDAP